MATSVGAATRNLANAQQLQQKSPPVSCNSLAVSQVVLAQPSRYLFARVRFVLMSTSNVLCLLGEAEFRVFDMDCCYRTEA